MANNLTFESKMGTVSNEIPIPLVMVNGGEWQAMKAPVTTPAAQSFTAATKNSNLGDP